MKRRVKLSGTMIATLLVLITMLPPLALADRKDNPHFLGIWEGIDEDDGSGIKLLISRENNGEFNLLWRETYWRFCEGNRGIVIGSGALDPNDKNILILNTVIKCFEIVKEETDTLTLRLVNKALLLATFRDEDEIVRDLPFYRISGRVKQGSREKKNDDK